MQSYYAKGGFTFSHRNMRFRGDLAKRPARPPSGRGTVVPLASVPFEEVLAYDRRCFPAPRPTFLKAWISQPDALSVGCRIEGGLRGFAVVRRCGEGCKVGPLFADDLSVAEDLLAPLTEFAAGGPIFIDAPENNRSAMELVRGWGMEEVFGCARMYLGPVPVSAQERVFGVTTLELG